MADLPSMPLFVDDYEAATAHLTMEEDGAYMRLLRLCWRTPGCSIPDDDAWIMRRLRVDADTYNRVVAPLIDEFFERKQGRIFQKRQRKEYDYVSRRVRARKEAGKKGGLAKSRKSNKKGSSKATNLPEQNPSKAVAPTPTPTPKVDTDVSTYPSPDGDAFEAFWNVVPRKVGKGQARTAFKAALKKADASTLIEAMRQYAENVRGKDPKYIPHPSTWLNGERWLDEPDKRGPSNAVNLAQRAAARFRGMDSRQGANPVVPLLPTRHGPGGSGGGTS